LHGRRNRSGAEIALVIGNAAYTNIPTLKNPANDAEDFTASLKRLGFSVDLSTNSDRKKMRELIDDFMAKTRDADISLFYYSGHGVQYQGENYLVPINAEVAVASDVAEECVPIARVIGRMNETGASTNIIILDACRDNPFVSVTRGIERGLAVIGQKPPESIIVYATGDNMKAEDGAGRNGVFTSALLANIEKPGALNDILLDVKAQVRSSATGARQQPAVYENLTRKVFLSGEAVAAVPTPQAIPPAIENTPKVTTTS
jgi:uncharacterized caspase-like protein